MEDDKMIAPPFTSVVIPVTAVGMERKKICKCYSQGWQS